MICLASPLQYLQSLPRQSIPKQGVYYVGMFKCCVKQIQNTNMQLRRPTVVKTVSMKYLTGLPMCCRLSVSDDPKLESWSCFQRPCMNQVQPGHIACSHCKPGSLSSSKFRSPAESTYLLASHVSSQQTTQGANNYHCVALQNFQGWRDWMVYSMLILWTWGAYQYHVKISGSFFEDMRHLAA